MRATSRKLRVSKIFVTRVLLVLSALGVSAHECAKKPSDIELRITPGELVKGVPRTISFVFLNITDHEERIPPVSPCIGQYSGTIKLRLDRQKRVNFSRSKPLLGRKNLVALRFV